MGSTTAKAFVEAKAGRLFRHEPRILRVRIDVEPDVRSRTPRFTANGRIELAGPDLTASVTADAASAAIILLIEKLDRMLRKRTSYLLRRRSTGETFALTPVLCCSPDLRAVLNLFPMNTVLICLAVRGAAG